MCVATSDVRFTPKSGHVRCNWGCPLWTKSGHRITSTQTAVPIARLERPGLRPIRMSVHGICDSKPDLVALVIALMSERVSFFASQVCRSASMMRLHVTGVHQNRFFLRWKPHHATPYTTILSATLRWEESLECDSKTIQICRQ